jgi:hypothetical protein
MGLLTHSKSKTVIRVRSTYETQHLASLRITLKSKDFHKITMGICISLALSPVWGNLHMIHTSLELALCSLSGDWVPLYWKYSIYNFLGRPGSWVGIATGYGLDGPGIETRWGRDFPHLFRPARGPTQPPVPWIPGLSRGRKRPGGDANPSPLPVPWPKNRIEIYLYSP